MDLQRFITEHEMSDSLQDFFSRTSRFHQVKNFREVKGPVGIPDHVLVRIIGPNILYAVAFELKLKDWKKGLIQAFRYKAYANSSFVVIDERFVCKAKENISAFRRAQVGLVSYSIDSQFRVIFNPKPRKPFSKALAQKFAEQTRVIFSGEELSKVSDRFIRSTSGAIDVNIFENSELY